MKSVERMSSNTDSNSTAAPMSADNGAPQPSVPRPPISVAASAAATTAKRTPSSGAPNINSPALSPSSEARLKSQVDGMTAEITRLEASVREAAREKEDVQKSLARLEKVQRERAEGFESNVKALRLDKDGQPLIDAASDDIFKSIDEALKSGTPDGLRALVKELRERLLLQQARNKKLAFELEMECGHVNILRAENQALKKQAVTMQAEVEREEEFITNRLMQRINNLKKEKGELLMKVEQEEEQITNALQRKLSQLQREKIEMEQALEQEQYPIHTPPTSDYPPSPTISPGIIEVMRAEVNSLRMRMHDVEKDYEENVASAREVYQKLRAEVVDLRSKLGLPCDQLEPTYPNAILPTLVLPTSVTLTGEFAARPHSSGIAMIGSLERRSRGSLITNHVRFRLLEGA
ncbi:hypothetical protein HDU96_008792 [Phlyctochytrium bullatum]|nr:hypothetical protein HDU96_008792 [Phlyctochytrium bullatum]